MPQTICRVTEQQIDEWLTAQTGTIRERLRLAMKELDIKNVDALLEQATINRSTAYELYRGTGFPSLRTIGRLCLTFGWTVTDLLGEDGG